MMESAAAYLPKKSLARPLGDDAHFIGADGRTIGVADGVGGWTKQGVDAGRYARDLMFNAFAAAACHPEAAAGSIDPTKLLADAFSNTTADGSSTACILTLKSNNCLHAANVGDSGFMIFRNGGILYKSPVQQFRFNHPYQLGNRTGCNRPIDAEEIKVYVRPGDMIVTGTDGLLDNLFPEEIENMIQVSEMEQWPPLQMAWALAEIAQSNSDHGATNTPWAEAARRRGLHHRGGKPDDITVIVSYVLP